ncbi:MAG: hypothetical protein H0V73_10920, partial [Chloroflexi bacterium]|nr:hypothetical protein [Chloroflexota bacterium]
PAPLLDATNRRFIIQDRTAAVQILLPGGATAPPVGARIRVHGAIGRAYGAPRIKAASVKRLGTEAAIPLELRTAPGAAHEWRLVRVRGDIVEIHRSGERWTAELLVGGTRIPIAGLAGAGIPFAALAEGRTAAIVGIVRRPHPSATDRRFAIVPRSPRDLAIGGPATAGSGAGASGAPSGGTVSGAAGPGSVPNPAGVPDVDLADLGRHAGESVRVGGLVRTVAPTGFDLDDGTAIASIRLADDAADIAGSIEVGDALNATGRIEIDPASSAPIVVVDDPAAVTLVGDLGAGEPDPNGAVVDPSSSPDPSAGAETTDSSTNLVAGLGDPVLPRVGATGLVVIALASFGVSWLRRQRTRRRFATRIAARLAAIASPATLAVAAASAPMALAFETATRPLPEPLNGQPAVASVDGDRSPAKATDFTDPAIGAWTGQGPSRAVPPPGRL